MIRFQLKLNKLRCLRYDSNLFTTTTLTRNSSSNIDFSTTLQLPKTSFPLKVNLKNNSDLDNSKKLYEWQIRQTDRKPFILHDGPPYANGKLHTGHAMNKILKDIINRFKVLEGYKVGYVPGWDCHGLPIELKALAKLKDKRIEPLQVRKLAREAASLAIQDQKSDYLKWSIMTDFDINYRTMETDYVVRQLHVFKKMCAKKLIYRKSKPVYWSPSTKTALAESELEYNPNHQSTAAYIKFKLDKISEQCKAKLSGLSKPIYALIWTTTPWTILANQAIAVHEDIVYSVIEHKEQYLIVAKSRLQAMQEILDSSSPLVEVAELTGQELSNSTYIHPIYHRTSPIIVADYVSAESGSGLVHTAPSHGNEDYLACQKHNIPTLSIVDDYGKYTEDAGPEFHKLAVLGNGNLKVLEKLVDLDALVHQYTFTHSYPYDWRSKKPVIQRATAQWFIDVSTITQQAVDSLNGVETLPKSGTNRLTKFLESRKEWCISRQRSWGVPIPAFYTQQGDPILNEEVIDYVIKVIEREGPDAWFKLATDALLPQQLRDKGYTRGFDTMDVWFDSGTSWALLDSPSLFPTASTTTTFDPAATDSKQSVVADIYLEGSDQHRGWFQSSLLTSIATRNLAPYKTLITHGFVLDKDGIKMSKSIGNIIAPDTIIDGGANKKLNPPYGADGLRLWTASSDYTKDVNLSNTVLQANGIALNKLRNLARFCIGNLYGFDAAEHKVDYKNLNKLDQLVLHQIFNLTKEAKGLYQSYQFGQLVKLLNSFQAQISATYFDVVKDRLYCDAINSSSRRSVQTVLFHLINIYATIINPILPNLSQEIFNEIQPLFKRGLTEKETFSPLQFGWPQLDSSWFNPDLEAKLQPMTQLRTLVNLQLAQLRQNQVIKSSLQAKVVINNLPKETGNLIGETLLELKEEIKDALIVSQLELNSQNDTDLIQQSDLGTPTELICDFNDSRQVAKVNVHVQLWDRACKCPRCWKFHLRNDQLDLCIRCEEVVKPSLS